MDETRASREGAVLPFIASPSVDKQERGVARGPVENEMQGDVLRGTAGSRLFDCRGDARPARTTRMDAEATAAFPGTPVGRGLSENCLAAGTVLGSAIRAHAREVHWEPVVPRIGSQCGR